MSRIYDKDNKLMEYRENNQGIVLTKGARGLFLLFKTVNGGKKARESIADFSFNQLYNKGKKNSKKYYGKRYSTLFFDKK
jgi:hypothetical protein